MAAILFVLFVVKKYFAQVLVNNFPIHNLYSSFLFLQKFVHILHASKWKSARKMIYLSLLNDYIFSVKHREKYLKLCFVLEFLKCKKKIIRRKSIVKSRNKQKKSR